MACRFLSVKADLAGLTKAARTDSRGTSLKGLQNAAAFVGLRRAGVQVSREALPDVPAPCIGWTNRDHYVVITGFNGRGEHGMATIQDPNEISRALAVEMEGAGFLWAAYTNRADALVIRGISDQLDGKAAADNSGFQNRAAEHAAAFAFEIIAQLKPSNEIDSEEVSLDRTEFWLRFRELAPRLYPTGPREGEVWTDAGGDLSRLDLSGDGRTQWSRAIRRVERGSDVTAQKLAERMLQDYPNNYELHALRSAASAFSA